jgi:hypothetical protein
MGALQAIQDNMDGVSFQFTEFFPGDLAAADFLLRQLPAYYFSFFHTETPFRFNFLKQFLYVTEENQISQGSLMMGFVSGKKSMGAYESDIKSSSRR